MAIRFWRIMRLMAAMALVVAGIAVALVLKGEPDASIHLLIATALAAGLSVLLGTALMTLMFLSSASGHDADAASPPDKDPE